MYDSEKVTLTTKKLQPESLSNIFENVVDLIEAIEDAKSPSSLKNAINRLCTRKWDIRRDTEEYTRLSTEDGFGNPKYLTVKKKK